MYQPGGPVEQHFGDRHYYNTIPEDSTSGVDPTRLAGLSYKYLRAVAEDWMYLRVGDDTYLPLAQVFFMLRAREHLPQQPLGMDKK